MRKAEIGKKAKVVLRWDVLPIDYTKEGEKSAISSLASKYGIDEKQIRLDPNFVIEDKQGKKTSIVSDSVNNVTDPKFHIELYREYMERNKEYSDVPFEEIVKLDSRINTLINYESYEKNRRYKILWIRWSNFLSYGDDNYIDFRDYKGLIRLHGEPANKSGKSTFACDLIRFALFGKIKSGKASRYDQYFNNYRPDCNEVRVECCLEIGGEEYIIRRVLVRPPKGKKGQVKNNVSYAKVLGNGNEEELVDVTNLEGESTTKTNKIIKETIGSEEDFDLIVSANAKDLDDLISLKDTERGRIISRWTGLSILEDKENKAMEEYRKACVGRNCDLYNREALKTEISDLTNENEEYTKDIEKDKIKLSLSEGNIEKYKKDRDKLLEKKKPIDANLTKYDIQTIETKIETLIADGKKKKAELDNVTEEIKRIGEVTQNEERINEIIAEISTISGKLGGLRAQIETLRNNNKKLTNEDVCPFCNRKMDTDEIHAQIQDNKNLINSLISEGVQLNEKKTSLEKESQEIQELNKIAKKKSTLKIKEGTLESTIKDMRNSLKEYMKIRKSIDENADAIKENNRLEADIRVLDENIRTEEGIRNKLNTEIISLEKDIEINKKEITKKEAIISKIEEELAEDRVWKTYLAMVGKNGISKILLNGILPRINGELNRLLNDVVDFTVEVELSDKNDVEFWLIRDDTKTRLAGASGYERTAAALALRFVLGQISNLSKPPFLLLDEILGGVASENYDDIKKLYDKIVPAYDFVFHITHLNLEDWHDSMITIQKIDNISSLKPNIQ